MQLVFPVCGCQGIQEALLGRLVGSVGSGVGESPDRRPAIEKQWSDARPLLEQSDQIGL